MGDLTGIRVLAFVGDVYEDLELWYPLLRLQEEGAVVTLAAEEIRTYTGKHGYPAEAEARIDAVRESEYDGLLIPGGFMPDKLRRIPRVLELCREFQSNGKMIAFICHAGWIPISAKIVNGRTVTSTPGIRDDLENAGATWLDQPVVEDDNFITARRPPDLPDFARAMVRYLAARGRGGTGDRGD